MKITQNDEIIVIEDPYEEKQALSAVIVAQHI
jgi:hypothetical protein